MAEAGWTSSTTLPHMPYALLPGCEAPGHLYAVLNNGDVWHTTDFGDSWRQLPFNLGRLWTAVMVESPALQNGLRPQSIGVPREVEVNGQATFEFQWLSPLGFSVVLFLLWGGLYVLIGVLMPLLHRTGATASLLIISARTDTIVFGQTPPELLRDDPALDRLRTILYYMLAGLLLLAGCFVLAMAWFGLRQRQAWALLALTIGAVIVLPYWYLALRPYFRDGVNLRLGDVPPFIWVPTALLLPAVVLGWIGLG